MQFVDLVIRGGEVATTAGLVRAGVVIREGRIAGLVDEQISVHAAAEIDARGRLILPGLIDPHTHMREPGTEEREDWETGTAAAAAGGVTTILEMPVSTPPTSSLSGFHTKRAIAERKAIVDFALYGGAGFSNLEQIPALAEAGAIGFKTFLHEPYADRLAEFEGMFATDDGVLLDIFRAVARTGLPQCVHAENNAIIQRRVAELRRTGNVGAGAHAESRPVIAEVEAVQRTLLLAAEAGARLHLCHISSASAVRLAHDGRTRMRTPVTIETCPQYLFLNREDALKLGPYAKISPPIRAEEERAALWDLFANGIVDVIGTDHSPHTQLAKERGWVDIFDAPAGAPGLETMLPLLLTRINDGTLSIARLVAATAENVARIFGLYPQKGTVQVGSDADLVIVDMQQEATIDVQRMYTKQRATARLFDGWRVRGVPVLTLVRGRVVMRDGVVVGQPGYGRLIRPVRRFTSAASTNPTPGGGWRI